jgi:hypothetical protein
MANAMIGRPSWPHRPGRGHDPRPGRVPSGRSQPDQGPAQEAIGEVAWLFGGTRAVMPLGGSGLSAVTLLLGAARLARRRAQVADTWTFGARVAAILLGL